MHEKTFLCILCDPFPYTCTPHQKLIQKFTEVLCSRSAGDWTQLFPSLLDHIRICRSEDFTPHNCKGSLKV